MPRPPLTNSYFQTNISTLKKQNEISSHDFLFAFDKVEEATRVKETTDSVNSEITNRYSAVENTFYLAISSVEHQENFRSFINIILLVNRLFFK